MIDRVITILGLVGSTKSEYVIKDGKIENLVVEKNENDKARYHFGPRLEKHFSLSKKSYTNTLPILCELFGEEKIIPLGTVKSRKIQEDVLRFEGFDETFMDRAPGLIEDEKNFTEIFATINDILSEGERIIVDITHGFRHLPILTTIALILENIKNIEKIEHIFFAKEIEPHREYEIIDLKEYLDVANVSFVLSSFNNNYTVAHHIRCINPVYNKLIENLSKFSEHILANSILELYRNENSVAERILESLRNIEKEDILGLQNYLAPIRLHLTTFLLLRNQPEYRQFYEVAKKLTVKGYFLNAITLLDEAIGHYCVSRFKEFSPEIEKEIRDFLSFDTSKAPLYELTNQSKNLVKHLKNMTGSYLVADKSEKLTSGQKSKLQEKKRKIKEDIPPEVFEELERLGLKMEFSREHHVGDNRLKRMVLAHLEKKEFLNEFRAFIRKTDDLRNNLAHANSSEAMAEIRGTMDELLSEFEELCITIDVLK